MIWIRSQDKEDLMYCEKISIDSEYDFACEYEIFGDEYLLAKYSTKEKALKVLDKMQKHINSCNYGEVFQMPADDEVKES